MVAAAVQQADLSAGIAVLRIDHVFFGNPQLTSTQAGSAPFCGLRGITLEHSFFATS
jgi:hypothetical protein